MLSYTLVHDLFLTTRRIDRNNFPELFHCEEKAEVQK